MIDFDSFNKLSRITRPFLHFFFFLSHLFKKHTEYMWAVAEVCYYYRNRNNYIRVNFIDS